MKKWETLQENEERWGNDLILPTQEWKADYGPALSKCLITLGELSMNCNIARIVIIHELYNIKSLHNKLFNLWKTMNSTLNETVSC